MSRTRTPLQPSAYCRFVASTCLDTYSARSPHASLATFCDQRATTVTESFGAIQGLAVDPGNTTHDLPMVAGGAGLSSLSRMASASYLGAFFRVAGPFLDRLAHMGGNTTARVATLLADPPAAKMDQSRATSVHAHTRRPSSCKPRSPPRTSTPSTSSPQEATSSCVRAILGH